MATVQTEVSLWSFDSLSLADSETIRVVDAGDHDSKQLSEDASARWGKLFRLAEGKLAAVRGTETSMTIALLPSSNPDAVDASYALQFGAALISGSVYIEMKGKYLAVCLCTVDGSLHRLILPSESNRSHDRPSSPTFHTWHKTVFKGDTHASFASWANACNVAVAGTNGRIFIVKFPEDYGASGHSGCRQSECADAVAWSGLLPFGTRAAAIDAVIGLASCDAGGGGHAVSLHSSGKLRFWSYLDAACVATTTLALPESFGMELHASSAFTVQARPEAGDGAQIVLGSASSSAGDVLIAVPVQFGPRSVLIQSQSCVSVNAVRGAMPRHLKTTLGVCTSVTLRGDKLWLAWSDQSSAGIVTCNNSPQVQPVFAPVHVVLPLDCGRPPVDGPSPDFPSTDAVSAHYLPQVFDSQRFNVSNVVHALEEFGCSVPAEELQSQPALQGRAMAIVSEASRRDAADDNHIKAYANAWNRLIVSCEADWTRDATLMDVVAIPSGIIVLRWGGFSAIHPATPHQAIHASALLSLTTDDAVESLSFQQQAQSTYRDPVQQAGAMIRLSAALRCVFPPHILAELDAAVAAPHSLQSCVVRVAKSFFTHAQCSADRSSAGDGTLTSLESVLATLGPLGNSSKSAGQIRTLLAAARDIFMLPNSMWWLSAAVDFVDVASDSSPSTPLSPDVPTSLKAFTNSLTLAARDLSILCALILHSDVFLTAAVDPALVARLQIRCLQLWSDYSVAELAAKATMTRMEPGCYLDDECIRGAAVPVPWSASSSVLAILALQNACSDCKAVIHAALVEPFIEFSAPEDVHRDPESPVIHPRYLCRLVQLLLSLKQFDLLATVCDRKLQLPASLATDDEDFEQRKCMYWTVRGLCYLDVAIRSRDKADALKAAVSCFHTGTSFYSPKLAIEYLLNLFGMFERLGFDTSFVSGLEVAIATAAVLRESIAEDEYVVTAWRQLWLKYFSTAVGEKRFDRAFTALRTISDFDKEIATACVKQMAIALVETENVDTLCSLPWSPQEFVTLWETLQVKAHASSDKDDAVSYFLVLFTLATRKQRHRLAAAAMYSRYRVENQQGAAAVKSLSTALASLSLLPPSQQYFLDNDWRLDSETPHAITSIDDVRREVMKAKARPSTALVFVKKQ